MELLLQLVLAVVLGGAIGLERELRSKPAGLRTNILICIGATLFTALSYRLALERGDPGRVAAQILTGVGFIGAGTILHTRGAVTGLTSAATIWVVAAIGMALGSRAYAEAVGTAALVFAVLAGLSRIDRLLDARGVTSQILIHARPEGDTVKELETLASVSGLEVERTASRRENVDLIVELDVRGPKSRIDQFLAALVHHRTVRSVSTGE